MARKILGLDLGSNSLGWALLEKNEKEISHIIDLGCRIFVRAVEEKVPIPKNAKRRDMRLGRRVIQRRAQRKQKMQNYLLLLDLLPKELKNHLQPEIILNDIGDPYQLRTKALDEQLTQYELGRVLLHFATRRGFLSSKKQHAGDLIDDPDTMAYLNTLDDTSSKDTEEGAFKQDIKLLRQQIQDSGARTLGEFLHKREQGQCKRNRNHEAGHIRTDRQMYKDELEQIWQQQAQYFSHLPDDFMQDKKGVKQIIFYQRPLKLKADRVGKCSLERNNNRAAIARLEAQRFRYLQDINNLQYFERHSDQWLDIGNDDKEKLKDFFERHEKITLTDLKRELGLDRLTKFNLERKNLKGNITACEIRSVLGDKWDAYSEQKQKELVEDLLSFQKKSALKKRLGKHWDLPVNQVVQLCLLEFEPGHSNHSLKAINKMLPALEKGSNYSEARKAAGYGYEKIEIKAQDKLPPPEQTSNPIVNRSLHELKRVVNAIIKQYGKPDAIRIEMARDLEMNTKRYKQHEAQQAKNRKANELAIEKFKQQEQGKYPSHDDKIKYRLWMDQSQCCAYSNQAIPVHLLFTADVEIDHILPYKKSLDDSYMNKVLCYKSENSEKADRTPKDAWAENEEKWNQISQAIGRWKGLESKVNRFYQTEDDLQERDFISSQLNDTRYISRLALEYVKQLGFERVERDVTPVKGAATAWLRHQWGLNTLLNETELKDRSDHRHHAIDAAVIACIDRSLYQKIYTWTKNNEKKINLNSPYPNFREELGENLKHMIVSHCPQHKLSGALHEETGAGYIEKHGGLVYRKNLAPDFKLKLVNNIVDEQVKSLVQAHLEKYGNDPKKAFADNVSVLHKDDKTPIKRVRVLQSKTNLKKLEYGKFGVKDKSGKVFKWMPYGNMHHVEVLQHQKTGKYKGEFVTMMEAHRRAMTGTCSAQRRGVPQEQIIKKNHGEGWQFMMALHINDMVSVKETSGESIFYRVQKLDGNGNRFYLREHSAATLKDKAQQLCISINRETFQKYDFKLHRINAIGIITDD